MLENASSNHTLISILIATRNRPQDLIPCVKSLLAQDYPNYEIVIFDQSVTDEAQQATRAAYGNPENLRYIRSETIGKSKALNGLVAAAQGEIFAFTDDDTEAPPDWLSSIAKAFREMPEADLLFGQVFAPPDTPPDFHVPALYFQERRLLKRGEVFGMGANMAFRSALVEKVTGYDTQLGPGGSLACAEDYDFLYRAQWAGAIAFAEPSAQLVHRAGRNFDQWSRVLLNYGTGDAAFAMKHLRCGDWKMLGNIARGLGYIFARGCLRVAQRAPQPGEFYYVRGYWQGIWASLKYPVDKRTRLYAPAAPRSAAGKGG